MQLHRQAEDEKITALYERISQDDDFDGESNSIVHQKCKCQAKFPPTIIKQKSPSQSKRKEQGPAKNHVN